MTDQATVIFHGSCPDGYTAAWLLHRYLTKHRVDVTLHHGSYGTEPPDVTGRDVYIVDFCYEPEHLLAIHQQALTLTILDHHQTALDWVMEVFGERVTTAWDPDLAFAKDVVVLDQTHSGAMLAMLWSKQHHQFVRYIQDRDLWQFRFGSRTKDVFAAVTSYDYTLSNWDDIADMSISELADLGEAINRYRDTLIQQVVSEAYQDYLLGYEDIWMAACPFAIGSDVAGELAKRDPERFAAYYVDKSRTLRKWGLRSAETGMNVALLAETRGGGGHAHASGFEMPVLGHPLFTSSEG